MRLMFDKSLLYSLKLILGLLYAYFIDSVVNMPRNSVEIATNNRPTLNMFKVLYLDLLYWYK